MAKLGYVKGATSVTVNVFILDSASTTGAGKTGLAYNTASLTAYYAREKAAAAAITLATQTATGAWSSGGFVEIDSTNLPGLYRLDIPDAALATGSNSVAVMLKGASGMAPLTLEIELEGVDRRDATAFGLSRLDAAVSSRMATYAQPTGFLAATFPGTVASTTNITAGTITTVTNLTNAPTAGDLTTTMKTSVQTAADAAVTANTLVNTMAGYIDTEVAAIKAKTDNLPANPAATGAQMALTAAAVDAVLDEVVEGTTTLRELLRGFAAALLGKADGLDTTTVHFRDLADAKNRITATVDANGNRTAITLDLS